MIKDKECLMLWFQDYNTDELIATACHDYDLERGYVELNLFDERRKRNYTFGKRNLEDCVDISKFRVLESPSTRSILNWSERNKLYDKCPYLMANA